MVEERIGKTVDVTVRGGVLYVTRSGRRLTMASGDRISSVHVEARDGGMLRILLIGERQMDILDLEDLREFEF